MATVPISSGGSAVLGSAQTGNADSTNTVDRGFNRGPAAVVVTTTVGATPTVKIDIQGSVDGTNFFNIGYALVATPETVAVAQITVTTAVTTTYLLRPTAPWRFLKLAYSSNTNVTLTATAYL
jgi:hypothetical protein